MSTLEMSKKLKIAIAISALLMAPLGAVALARGGGGGHSGRGGRSFGGGHGFAGGRSFVGGRSFAGGRSFSGGHFQRSPYVGGYRGGQTFSSSPRTSAPRMNTYINRGFSNFGGRSYSQAFRLPGAERFQSRGFNASPAIRSNGENFRGFANRGNSGFLGRSENHLMTRLPQGTIGAHQWNRNRLSGNERQSNSVATRDSFVRNHRDATFLGKTSSGISRFRDASGRHFTFEDRDRFHGRFDSDDRFHHRFDHDFFFRDRHHRLLSFIIWPDFCYPVFYDWGPYYGFNYAYPYYCQRYVFVSLGGYWPDYDYLRYYWYPGYLYGWYGYNPVAEQLGGDTYNYYTYNYDYAQQAAGGITPVDSNTFADVRAKMSQQKPQQPAAQTPADAYFDDGVKAFGEGSYSQAADKFAEAMKLSPNDTVLPFAYAQAQFAEGQYKQAADTLRTAVQKSPPDKMGVYYPRGLYLDENVLTGQIDGLAKVVENNPSDSNLQLLLGYQWLGIGDTQKAIEPLKNAQSNPENQAAATMLLNLAEKIQGAGAAQ
jgi:tetratricopeptide (TPR) repeat protein